MRLDLTDEAIQDEGFLVFLIEALHSLTMLHEALDDRILTKSVSSGLGRFSSTAPSIA
jgi:hypothetical protein